MFLWSPKTKVDFPEGVKGAFLGFPDLEFLNLLRFRVLGGGWVFCVTIFVDVLQLLSGVCRFNTGSTEG